MAEKKTFTQRVVAVQRDLKAPKSQFNKFGGYRYRSAEDILTAAKPLLAEQGLICTISDDVVIKADEKMDKARVYIKATATIFDAENEKDNISVSAWAREDDSKKGMDGAQVTGSASSYARKYALNGLFLIDDTKDPDATNTHGADAAACVQKAKELKEQKEAEQPAVIDPFEKEQVIAQIKAAKSREELNSIWKTNTKLQKDEEVFKAAQEAGKKFPKQ